MAYLSLLIKKTLKNRSVWLSFLLPILVLFGFWGRNIMTESNPFLAQMQQNRQTVEMTIGVEGQSPESTEHLQKIAAIEQDYRQGLFSQAYHQALQLNQTVEIFRLNTPDADWTEQLWQKLAAANLPIEQTGQETSAWLFLYRWLTSLFPIIIVMSATFVLTLIFHFSYHEKINYDQLLPINANKQKTMQLLWAFSLLLGGVIAITGIIFLITGLVRGFNSSTYPILVYGNPEIVSQPVQLIVQKSLVLVILSLAALTVTSLLLTRLIKNQLAAFFLTLMFYLGQAYLPETLRSFKEWVHLLPGYYLRSTEVVTESLAVAMENSNVHFSQGILVISVYVLGVLMLIFGEGLRQRR